MAGRPASRQPHHSHEARPYLLRQIHNKGVDAFLGSTIDRAIVERLLERAITRMIDVNYHVITALGQPPPADYHNSFLQLPELGILDGDFARQIARAVGLRNRLVHDYEDLDPRKVFEALGSEMQDMPERQPRFRRVLFPSCSHVWEEVFRRSFWEQNASTTAFAVVAQLV